MTIEEINEMFKPLAIYQVGSSTWLDGHDTDLLLLFNTQKEVSECSKKLLKDDLIKTIGYDVFRKTVERQKAILPTYAYATHFAKLLKGEEQNIDLDILGANRTNYINVLKDCKYIPKSSKGLYHVWVGARMIELNTYDLSDKDKATAQKMKDKGLTDTQYKSLMKKLEELQ